MNSRRICGGLACVALTFMTSAGAGAQTSIPIRQLGALERFTTDPLLSAVEAIQLGSGRVLVNDPMGRRVLLFDSTLAHPILVADTTPATDNAYGKRRGGTIMRFHADSALYIDQASLTMFVVSPTGQLGRVMAFPQPPSSGLMARAGRVQLVTGGDEGPPGFDARGRLVYHTSAGFAPGTMSLSAEPGAGGGAEAVSENLYSDSAFIFRVDLATRRLDTIATVRLPKGVLRVRTRGDNPVAIENTFDPLPVIDQWAVLPDGTLAIVRGRDYHIDWVGSDGASSSTPKMAFDWQRVSNDRKQALQDSVEQAWRAQRAAGGRGAGAAEVGVPNLLVRLPTDSISDYVPPFKRGAVRADAEGNVWIRTTTIVGGRPVYDVVDRRGQTVDRVQLPANRVIAGFGPGVIYMAVADPSGRVRLERARIK